MARCPMCRPLAHPDCTSTGKLAAVGVVQWQFKGAWQRAGRVESSSGAGGVDLGSSSAPSRTEKRSQYSLSSPQNITREPKEGTSGFFWGGNIRSPFLRLSKGLVLVMYQHYKG